MVSTGGSAGPNQSLLRSILQRLEEQRRDDPDVWERIQQQMAKMNEDENLRPGERFYR